MGLIKFFPYLASSIINNNSNFAKAFSGDTLLSSTDAKE